MWLDSPEGDHRLLGLVAEFNHVKYLQLQFNHDESKDGVFLLQVSY